MVVGIEVEDVVGARELDEVVGGGNDVVMGEVEVITEVVGGEEVNVTVVVCVLARREVVVEGGGASVDVAGRVSAVLVLLDDIVKMRLYLSLFGCLL